MKVLQQTTQAGAAELKALKSLQKILDKAEETFSEYGLGDFRTEVLLPIRFTRFQRIREQFNALVNQMEATLETTSK